MPEFVVCVHKRASRLTRSAFWAIALLGAVVVPLNAFLDTTALVHLLRVTEAKVLIVDDERVAKVKAAGEELGGSLQHIFTVRVDAPPPGMERLEDAVRPFAGSSLERLGAVGIGPDDDCSAFCTSGSCGCYVRADLSGTSALPKAVLSAQRAFITNIGNVMLAIRRNILRRGENIPAPDPTAPQQGVLISVPLFHATGTQTLLMLTTAGGGKVSGLEEGVS